MMRSQPQWGTEKLGEIALFKTGKLDSNAAVSDGKYPFFTCSQETLRTNTFSFDTECVLLAGNNAAGIFPLKYFRGKFDAYQRTYVITPRNNDRLDVRFLYYALRPKLAEFRSISTGAATKFLTLGILNETLLQIPPLKTQCRIAAILGAYDDLIEVNQRRIAMLEAMARGLFTEWFTRLRFPGHEDVAIEDTPNGPLPAGWMYDTLANVVAINAASLRPASAPAEIGYIDIASVSPGRIDTINRMSFSDAPGRARRRVRDGSILWSNVRPNRRSFALVLDPTPDIVASTGFTVLDARETTFAYLYQWVTTDEFVGYLVGNAQGAAYPAVTAATFERAIVLLPPSNLVARYTAFAEPMLRLADQLQKSNANLAAARDLLLPRLISGQLSVTQAKQELEAA
ncbi:restriction endonuclease subunit S [Ralstonia holmesii]|uniref:restriction endonuclease subunit S n=1 Tax=Ralstonia holmesii TaxID=3058602 RepID=UPI002930B692|nr:restriction endonuclease subunit S [Ralstonia sp. LMG 32967]